MRAMKSLRSSAVLFGALALAWALCSCAASSKSSAPAAATAWPGEMRSADPHDEIERLWSEIQAWSGEGSMAQEPGGEQPASIESVEATSESVEAGTSAAESEPMARAPRATSPRKLCPDESGDAAPGCTDVCTLGASICDNADHICRLAGELPGDAWAEETCTKARAACARATERCCQCIRDSDN